MYFRCTSPFQARIGSAFLDVRIGDVLDDSDDLVRSHGHHFEKIDYLPDHIAEQLDQAADSRRQVINLLSRGELTDGQRQRVDALGRNVAKVNDAVNSFIANRDDQVDALRAKAAAQPDALVHGDGPRAAGEYAAQRRTTPEARERDELRRMLDNHVTRGSLTGEGAERVEALTAIGPTTERDLARKWAQATGSEAYERAFAKAFTDPARAMLLFTDEERAAYQRVYELRAALAVGGNGAEMVPLTLDPSISLTNNGSINNLRAIARVERTVTSSWKGITSAGATSEWKPELAEAASGDPDIDPVDIPVHMNSTTVQFSYEAGMDVPDLLSELRRIMLDSAENLNNEAYTRGTGVGMPKTTSHLGLLWTSRSSLIARR